MRHRRAAAWLAILIAIAAGRSAASREALRPEIPDDPPARRAPHEDARARSLGARVTFASWLSIQVNVDANGMNIVGDAANEPTIAVNPTDPDNIVIGWRQFDNVTSNFRQAGWAYSTNGGQSWTFPGVLTPGVFRSDPVMDFDASGTLYFQNIRQSLDADVFRSVDGGATWLAPVPEFGGDKNWLVVDRSGGIGEGNVYGIWQRFSGCCGTRTFTRSVNAGASYENPVNVALFPTFGTMAVGPAGEVYAAGIDGTTTQDFETFVASRSLDARDAAETPTFSGTIVELGGSMSFNAGPNPGGLLGQANVAVDTSTTFAHGFVYLLASVEPDTGIDPLDLYLAASHDGGVTWNPPVRVNTDPPAAHGWQWFGALSVAPNRRIDVIWADTRASGQDNISQLFYAWSWNGGQSWSKNIAVSPPFDSHLGWPNQNKIGDYYSIVSDETGANVAYAATFQGEQDVYFLRVFPDCNSNGVSDLTDIAAGTVLDCNGNSVPDGCEFQPDCLGAGVVPAGDGGVPGAPLLLDKTAGGIELGWSSSCRPGDSDYGIYEGELGDFTSHIPVTCTTGGDLQIDLVPAEASTYYLVVPHNDVREGSYGTNGDGMQRPQSGAACRPQAIGACRAVE